MCHSIGSVSTATLYEEILPIVLHKYTCTVLSVELLDNVRTEYALLAVLPLALCN